MCLHCKEYYINCLHKIYLCGFDEISENSKVSTNIAGCGGGTEWPRLIRSLKKLWCGPVLFGNVRT